MSWGTYRFFFEGWFEDQSFLSEGWSELHLLFLSVCFLPSFEKAKGDSQDLFPLRRARRFLADRGVNGDLLFLDGLAGPVCC